MKSASIGASLPWRSYGKVDVVRGSGEIERKGGSKDMKRGERSGVEG
jgi:hypothetical protein